MSVTSGMRLRTFYYIWRAERHLDTSALQSSLTGLLPPSVRQNKNLGLRYRQGNELWSSYWNQPRKPTVLITFNFTARTALLTVSTFSGVGTERVRSGDFLFVTDPVVLNSSTHESIVLWSGIVPRRSTLNYPRLVFLLCFREVSDSKLGQRQAILSIYLAPKTSWFPFTSCPIVNAFLQ